MDLRKICDIFCVIAGLGIIIFGFLIRTGNIENVDPARATLPIILGSLIFLWSLFSFVRRGRP